MSHCEAKHNEGNTPRRRCARMMLLIGGTAVLLSATIVGCGSGTAPSLGGEASEGTTPASDPIGEQLFLDTRFSQFFATHMTSVNAPLQTGDPVVATVPTADGPLPGPFAGQSINCRSCHFVTEFQGVANAGNRTYADFTTRSAIPLTIGGFDHTPRNAMQMVGTFAPHSGPQFLHFDGEFASGEDLVVGTLTGRNFGWGPTEFNTAVAHIARVIREDDGTGALAADRGNGLSYAILFKGTDTRIPAEIRLPASQRIDVTTATDIQIVNEIALCMAQYFEDLQFKQDNVGRYDTSPYDLFLNANHLPLAPLTGETNLAYSQRLYKQVVALGDPTYITPDNGSYAYHPFGFQFGALELQGLKIFLKAAASGTGNDQHAGNCAACHTPPDFTDFIFHNTGVTQEEYDGAHGEGAFAMLHIPSLSERNADYDRYLPQNPGHPNASEAMRRASSASNPSYADLGLWNIYLNDAYPNPQANLKSFVCGAGQDCTIDFGLASTIAQFKTPLLRDLVDSAPYFHNGSAAKFDDVINFYIKSSALAKAGKLRNSPAQFANMSLSPDDVKALVAFLTAITEDYDDA